MNEQSGRVRQWFNAIYDKLSQSKLRRLILIGLATAVMLLIGWWLYAHGQERLVAPLADRLWRIHTTLQMLSQESLWGMLLFIAMANVILILRRVGYAPPAPKLSPPLAGRVGAWLEMLRVAGQPGFLGEQLVGSARALLVKVLTAREHQTANDVWQRIRRGQLPLSAEARELLARSRSFTPSPALRGPRRRQTTIAVMNEIAAYLENTNETTNSLESLESPRGLPSNEVKDES
jgi:hypothetical protein